MISTKTASDRSIEDLLTKTTELDIFRFYIDDFCVGCNISSPLRIDDHNPSFQIFKTSKGLRWKDFGTGSSGDFVEFVKLKFGLDFKTALHKIYSDLKLIKSQSVSYYVVPGVSMRREIQVFKRKFNSTDLKFWLEFGINEKTLTKYEVSALSKYSLIEGTKRKDFICKSSSSVYCYHYGSYNYRLYSPFSKEYKWICNAGSEILQGWNQLPDKGDLLVITSSQKDVMLLDGLGYASIAPQSEHTIVPESIISNLIERFNRIFVLFDNDSAGITASKRYQRYDFKCVFLPEGPKDPSDYYKQFGKENTELILKKIL